MFADVDVEDSRNRDRDLLSRITGFLADIGLPARYGSIEGRTALPGVTVERGVIIVDRLSLDYPGDVLHEAGHLSTVPAAERATVGRDAGRDPAGEMIAIAWSYAAAVHLEIDPAVVFHSGGYRGWSESIIENFAAGRYFGVSSLQWIGLAFDMKQAGAFGVQPYPQMQRWLRS